MHEHAEGSTSEDVPSHQDRTVKGGTVLIGIIQAGETARETAQDRSAVPGYHYILRHGEMTRGEGRYQRTAGLDGQCSVDDGRPVRDDAYSLHQDVAERTGKNTR
jgi:hypothetical protein